MLVKGMGIAKPVAAVAASCVRDYAVTSLLCRLRAPKAAELARKWRIDVNPPVGKKRGKEFECHNPKLTSAFERVKGYLNEPFTERYFVQATGKTYHSGKTQQNFTSSLSST